MGAKAVRSFPVFSVVYKKMERAKGDFDKRRSDQSHAWEEE
jgi:hypothetical protein